MSEPVSKKYDLEERTAKFAEEIVDLCKKAPKTTVTIPIIENLLLQFY